jgi:hypothetical protein
MFCCIILIHLPTSAAWKTSYEIIQFALGHEFMIYLRGDTTVYNTADCSVGARAGDATGCGSGSDGSCSKPNVQHRWMIKNGTKSAFHNHIFNHFNHTKINGKSSPNP